jgi:hypothetical protein
MWHVRGGGHQHRRPTFRDVQELLNERKCSLWGVALETLGMIDNVVPYSLYVQHIVLTNEWQVLDPCLEAVPRMLRTRRLTLTLR